MEHGYLDVPVCQQQVDDDVDRKALHVVQSLLDPVQFGGQLHAGVQLPSLTDLIQNRLAEILAVRGEDTEERKSIVFMMEQHICCEPPQFPVFILSTACSY